MRLDRRDERYNGPWHFSVIEHINSNFDWPSGFYHTLRSTIMSVPTQEEVENGAVSPTGSQKIQFFTISVERDVVTERRIWRKLDLYILPVVSLLELLNFL
jgi:hypothetical protein